MLEESEDKLWPKEAQALRSEGKSECFLWFLCGENLGG
jgi:hypothetical protein